MSVFHKSVLSKEVIEYLRIRNGGKYIDATIGGGGHSLEMIKKGALVLGIDQDQDALTEIKNSLTGEYQQKINLVKGNFKNIREIAIENGFSPVNGILFDLGVSSYQLDTAKRGFSFRSDGPLDMRMDRSTDLTAAEIINRESFDSLVELFMYYGEEPLAKPIASGIIKYRSGKKILTTKELSLIINEVYKRIGRDTETNPSTKVFQALRIKVNEELDALRVALNKSIDILEIKGRLVVLSYHSLEDRITKLTFNRIENSGKVKIITKKPIYPEFTEIKNNPRARSAKMRVCEKL